MFLNHDTAFTAFDTIATATRSATATLAASTMVETRQGWRAADTLCPGDRIASLDGGFAQIRSIRAAAATGALWLVPAGVLNTCTDLVLPAGSKVGLHRPAIMSSHGQPVLLSTVEALAGHRGIRPLLSRRHPLLALTLDDEELIYAQTGALVHAALNDGDSYFETLEYGQARALLALSRRGFAAPDNVRAA